MRAFQIWTIGLIHNFFWALSLGMEDMTFALGAVSVFSFIVLGIASGIDGAFV